MAIIMKKKCIIKNCDKTSRANGMCMMHYDQKRRKSKKYRESLKKYHKSDSYLRYQEKWKTKNEEKCKAYSKNYQNSPEWKAYSRAYHKKNKEKINERHRKRHQEIRNIVLNHYSNNHPKCACPSCNENHIEFLAIDHTNGGGNKHRKNIGTSNSAHFYLWLIKNNFPSGFRVLCHNCNMSLSRYGYCPHVSEKLTRPKAF